MADKRLSQDEASRQMTAADKRIKGISSIASNTVKRAKILEIEKQYGTPTGNKQAVTSVDKALKSLSKSTEVLAHGVKLITVETARGVKNITASGAKAMNEYARAIGEDININRQNFMVMTIGKFTPLVGYAVAKMMETAVFRNMIEKMKAGLNRALNAVTSRFKKLAMAGWDKGKDLWNSFRDRISGKRGAVKTKLANARAAKKDKKYFTQDSAIKAALADAKVAGEIRKRSRTNDIENQVPHMATGGFVKKEGLAKIHAAEVVQPIDKLVETIVKSVTATMDKRDGKRNKVDDDSITSPGFFKKAKKRDLFGMEKVTDKITRTFDIMTRRSIKLETRIMKRDKANQKGLIGSFMEAYSNEAKQEELPLMERQVRATLELKKTISGENKTFSAAISKMLYEHPLFHASLLMVKGFTKSVAMPFKVMFKRRGKATYANQLSSKGTVFEQLANTSAKTYNDMMLKLDDIIANTYVSGQSTNAIMAATQGAKISSGPDLRTAPNQKKSWSIAGSTYKWLVKKPAEKISSLMKKYDPDSIPTKILTANLSPKAAWKAAKKVGTEKLFGTEEERAEKKAHQEKLDAEVREGYKRDAAAKKIRREKEKAEAKARAKVEIEEKDRRRARETEKRRSILQFQKQAKDEAKKQRAKVKPIIESRKVDDDIQSIVGPGKERAKEVRKQMEKEAKEAKKQKKASYIARLQGSDGIGGKDRTGQKTTSARLDEIAKNTKANVEATREGSKTSSGWFSKLRGIFSLAIPILMGMFDFVKSIPGKLINLFTGGKFLGAIGGALSGALGKVVKALIGLPIIKTLMQKVGLGKAIPGLEKIGAKATAKAAAKVAAKEAAKAGVKTGAGIIAREGAEAAAKTGAGIAAKEGADIAGKGLLKVGGKTVLRSMAKKIPILGALIGLGFAAKRAMAGDFTGAAMEAASGAASIVPGAGTAASVGIDMALAARDFKKSPETKAVEKSIEKQAKDSKLSTLPAVVNPSVSETADGLTKEQKDRIVKVQGIVADWGPVANSFLGGTASGNALVMLLQTYTRNNPTELADKASSIVGMGEKKWKDAGGSEAVFVMARAINENKNSFLKSAIQGYKGTGSSDHYDPSRENANLAGTAGKYASKGTKFIKEKDNQYQISSKLKNMDDKYKISDTASSATESAKTAIRLRNMQEGSFKDKAMDKASGSYNVTDDILFKGLDKGRTVAKATRDKTNKAILDLPWTLDNLSKSVVSGYSEMSDFLGKAYGDPKEFYTETKNKLWGGINKIKEYSEGTYKAISDMYIISKNEAEYLFAVRNKNAFASAGTGGSLAYAEDRMLSSGMNGKKVAAMGARKDVGLAEMTSDAVNKGLDGMKEMAAKTSKQTATMVNHIVSNNSSKVVATNSSTNASQGRNSSPVDASVQAIMTANF